jgi:hypothetical protein
VKPNIENIRGLNLAVVKLMVVQVTKLSLYHKIHTISTICSVKPVLTEDLCAVQKEVLSITSIFIRNKPIFLSERMLHKGYYLKSSVEEKYLWLRVLRGLMSR